MSPEQRNSLSHHPEYTPGVESGFNTMVANYEAQQSTAQAESDHASAMLTELNQLNDVAQNQVFAQDGEIATHFKHERGGKQKLDTYREELVDLQDEYNLELYMAKEVMDFRHPMTEEAQEAKDTLVKAHATRIMREEGVTKKEAREYAEIELENKLIIDLEKSSPLNRSFDKQAVTQHNTNHNNPKKKPATTSPKSTSKSPKSGEGDNPSADDGGKPPVDSGDKGGDSPKPKAESADDAAKKEAAAKQAQEEAEAIRQAAEREAAEARAEAEAVRKAAEEEAKARAEELQEAARLAATEAALRKQQAEADAKKVLEDARAEASRLVGDAQAEADRQQNGVEINGVTYRRQILNNDQEFADPSQAEFVWVPDASTIDQKLNKLVDWEPTVQEIDGKNYMKVPSRAYNGKDQGWNSYELRTRQYPDEFIFVEVPKDGMKFPSGKLGNPLKGTIFERSKKTAEPDNTQDQDDTQVERTRQLSGLKAKLGGVATGRGRSQGRVKSGVKKAVGTLAEKAKEARKSNKDTDWRLLNIIHDEDFQSEYGQLTGSQKLAARKDLRAIQSRLENANHRASQKQAERYADGGDEEKVRFYDAISAAEVFINNKSTFDGTGDRLVNQTNKEATLDDFMQYAQTRLSVNNDQDSAVWQEAFQFAQRKYFADRAQRRLELTNED